MLKPRKCVVELREYHSPLVEGPVDLRLDMNESTTGCSPVVLAKIKRLSEKTLALYPRREAAEKFVAKFLNHPMSQVLLTNGADEAIDLLCRAYLEPDDEVIVITPAFAMYEIFARAAGAKVVAIPAGPDFVFPTAEVLAAITPRTRLIIITNPNNPTGVAVPSGDIIKMFQAAPDAAVLVDEAYFEFYGQTMMDYCGRMRNLFVARTFSKAYGLAGMRIGVLVGHSEHIQALRRICPPFNLNVFAVECMRDALTDQKFVNDYVQQVRTTRGWFQEQMAGLGIKFWPSNGNFVLVDFGEKKQAMLKQLLAWGISLRDRPDCASCVRVSIGKQQEMEVVVMALKQLLAKKEAEPEQEQATP